jgi:2-hydroxy-6-oxonona-2,4-dienedioate hydrolase
MISTTWLSLMGAAVQYGGNRYPGRYLEAGSGEALLCFHGNGGHVENFSRNVMAYAEHFHVYALDAVWHGYGPQVPFNPELVTTYVDQVLDFMDWKGIEHACIEGQSMGGWTAMRLAFEYPERVHKLVLTTTQGYLLAAKDSEPAVEGMPAPSGIDRQLRALDDPTFENMRLRMVGNVARPESLPDEMIAIRQHIFRRPETNRSLRQVVSAYFAGPGSPAWKLALTDAELARIPAPTLVYWADKNPVPPSAGRRLAASIPGARFYCAADTGHMAQLEHADEHNREVLRFLTGDATLEPRPVEEPETART